MDNISIISYSAVFQSDFKRLNVAWIETFFRLEPHDHEQLDHPEIYILPNNGQIFLAQLDDEIIGCVAVVNTGDTGFELAKMAVSPAVQGKGIGKKLCLAAIDHVRKLGEKRIWLESNRKLTPAITMYKNVGFREVPMAPSPYDRVDIRMEMQL